MELQYRPNILSVLCGEAQGSAFLAGDYLLTAKHVVYHHLNDRKPVLLEYGDKQYKATAHQLGTDADGLDVALIIPPKTLLTALRKDRVEYFQLAPIPSVRLLDQELVTCGFPNEIGNGVDQVSVRLKAMTCVKDRTYDVITARRDNYSFNRYNGFSGSPVINSRGVAVGITVVEVSNKVAFISFHQIKSFLAAANIKFLSEDNVLRYDTSVTGRAYCYDFYEEQLRRVGHGYDANSVIANKEFSVRLNQFVSPKVLKRRKDDLSRLRQEIKTKGLQRDTLMRKRLQVLSQRVVSASQQFMYITGTAGVGKTCLLCSAMPQLLEKTHVYLLFGNQFTNDADAFTQLLSLCHLDSHRLKALSQTVRDLATDYPVLFIIDGLNEAPGERYWRRELRNLIHIFQKDYPGVKLLVSMRQPAEQYILTAFDHPEQYPTYEIKGFSPQVFDQALTVYQQKAGCVIKPETAHHFRRELYNPFFLRLFCSSYACMPASERDSLRYMDFFGIFLRECNAIVSEQVEEDEYCDITQLALQRIARLSIDSFRAGKVQRGAIRQLTDQICPNRSWPKSLLKSLLDEDLLTQATTSDALEHLQFGLPRLGHFLKAEELLKSSRTDQEIVTYISKNWHEYNQLNESSTALDNLTSALVACWNRPTQLVDFPEFNTLPFVLQVQKALEYVKEDNSPNLQRWLKKAEKKLQQAESPIDLFLRAKAVDAHALHQVLLSMSIDQRDEQWTVLVNRYFDRLDLTSLQKAVKSAKKEDLRLLLLLCWLLTTSYPAAHNQISDLLAELFSRDCSLITQAVLLFRYVDDNYIHHGLLKAIARVVESEDDHPEHVSAICRLLLRIYYSNKTSRRDLLIRYWTLRIFESAYHLLQDFSYWQQAIETFHSQLSISSKKLDHQITAQAGTQLQLKSLQTDSDFHKYILTQGEHQSLNHLGTWINENGVVKDIDVDILTEQMEAVMASKHYVLGPKSSEFDMAFRKDDNQGPNTRERIGKKYVWLALFDMLCAIKDNDALSQAVEKSALPNTDSLYQKLYPWFFRSIYTV